MTTYQLINPSDDYSFEAPDDNVADAVTTILGGEYGWNRDDVSGGLSMFLDDEGQDELGERVLVVIRTRAAELSAAFRSLEIDRPGRERTGSDPDAWHEQKRTSANDIRKQAQYYADKLDAGLVSV